MKIHTIQLLRAIAAFLVVCWHAQLMIPQFPKIVPYFFGNAGVYLFFAISGFLMVFVTDSREHSALEFLKARVIRIVPIYWIYILGTALLMVFLPFLFRNNELSISHLLLSILFVPHKTATDPGTFLPMVRVGWTLIYEAFFYLLFATAMTISFRYRTLLTSAALTVLLLLHLWLAPSINEFFPLYVYGDPIIMQFMFGMVVAYAFKHWWWVKVSTAQFLVVLVLAAVIMSLGNGTKDMDGLVRLALYGLPSALVVLCGLLVVDQDRLDRRLVAVLGDSSYSLYLVHMLPLALMRWVWTALHLPVEGIGWAVTFIVLAASLAVGCGIVSYKVVEYPSMRFLKSRTAS